MKSCNIWGGAMAEQRIPKFKNVCEFKLARKKEGNRQRRIKRRLARIKYELEQKFGKAA